MSEKVLTDFEIVQILNTDRPKTGWAYGLCREVEAKVVSRCRAQGGNTSNNITKAAANKAEEDEELKHLRSAIESMPQRTVQGCEYVHLDSVLAEICQLEIIAADRAARPVANKAEVEPVVQLAESRAQRVYIAGPMTGIAEYNFPAFNAAAEEMRASGWHVENPADHGIVDGADWADYLHYDLSRLATVSAIYLLPGWSKSRGAVLETHIAQALGMAIFYADGAEVAAPPATTGASTARDHALEEAAALVEGCDKRASLRGISIAIRALKGSVGASTVLTDERIVNAGSMPPDEGEMKSAAFELAKWLSAALDDENVCPEYKAAINSWFNAAMPSAHVAIESGTQYIMDAISYYAESKDGRTLDRIRVMVNEGELAREVAAQAGQVAVPDFHNVTAVKRISDQSLTITFASCASCSKFERAAAPSPAKESK